MDSSKRFLRKAGEPEGARSGHLKRDYSCTFDCRRVCLLTRVYQIPVQRRILLLGDTDTAKKLVVRAWVLSEVENDPAATIRNASVLGPGLVQIHRYKRDLGPRNEAVPLAASRPSITYPTIAVYAKIEALAGLHQYDEAYALANASLARIQGTRYEGRDSDAKKSSRDKSNGRAGRALNYDDK
jgi:hypothetical protein